MGSPGLAGLPKTHLLTVPATPRPGQLPPPGPAGLGPPQQLKFLCCQSSDRKMEALKGWLQLHSAGLLEVSGVLLALTVLAFLYRRSRLKAAAASGEGKEPTSKNLTRVRQILPTYSNN